jgi:hypothetical protein
VAPSTAAEIKAAMPDDDRAQWERAARGDEHALAKDFDEVLQWFDADSQFMHLSSRWLADHIPAAELLWRAGGHMDPKGDEEARLFAWLGHGHFPAAH